MKFKNIVFLLFLVDLSVFAHPPEKEFSAWLKYTGKASYYHSKFNGRRTSNGDIFNNKKLTAAHKTLPLGTWVKVTNLNNGNTIIVRINDRLPQNSKRSIDLSRKAAEELGFIKAGLADVEIKVIYPLID